MREEAAVRGKAVIYLDHAATSWPKPEGVLEAMNRFLREVGANPGRSGHRLSIEAARIVYDAREALAELFRVRDPLRIVFTHNATEALNLALRGLLRPGQQVVTSSLEHNSMMRPLRSLEQQGVEVTVVPCSPRGELDLAAVEAALRPHTRLLAFNHASNVMGALLPVAEIGALARRYGLLCLIDAAQTAGAVPLDLSELPIDLLAFTGHKSLYGPPGTGGLVIGPRVPLEELEPLCRGGTGSRSEEEFQPPFLPDKYESGTPNTVGLAGLAAGVRFVLQQTVEAIRRREQALTQLLLDGLRSLPGVTVYGPLQADRQTATVSFNVAGLSPSEVGLRLDEEYGICCRVGLHCAPSAHRTLGTFPEGTVRFALGPHNTEEEVAQALAAVAGIAR
jgi:cysteine desulfurase family protein